MLRFEKHEKLSKYTTFSWQNKALNKMTVVLTLNNILTLTEAEISQLSKRELERLKSKLAAKIDTATKQADISQGSTKEFWENQKANLLKVYQLVTIRLS